MATGQPWPSPASRPTCCGPTVAASPRRCAPIWVLVDTDLDRRAGQALADARTCTRGATLAETLQRALLPGLPQLPGIAADVHHTRAIAGAAVGGDLYDLLDIPEDAVGIVVADVAGHDVDAAAAMGTLRDLSRTQSWSGPALDPAQVLTGVDRLTEVLHVLALATAVLLQAHRPARAGTGWTVHHANAGHPPVLVRVPDSRVEPSTAEQGLLLGVEPSRPRRTTTRLVPAGTQLVLCTDGLVEQPGPDAGPARDIDDGTAGVSRLRAFPAGAAPETVVDGLSALVVGRSDDTVILVVQLGDQSCWWHLHPLTRALGHAAGGAEIERTLAIVVMPVATSWWRTTGSATTIVNRLPALACLAARCRRRSIADELRKVTPVRSARPGRSLAGTSSWNRRTASLLTWPVKTRSGPSPSRSAETCPSGGGDGVTGASTGAVSADVPPSALPTRCRAA